MCLFCKLVVAVSTIFDLLINTVNSCSHSIVCNTQLMDCGLCPNTTIYAQIVLRATILSNLNTDMKNQFLYSV